MHYAVLIVYVHIWELTFTNTPITLLWVVQIWNGPTPIIISQRAHYKIHNSSRLCRADVESILHMFVNCTKTKTLWNDIKDQILHKLGIHINLDPLTIILGYLLCDTNQSGWIPFSYKGRNISFSAAMNNIIRCISNDLKFKAWITIN